jgi:hypothetical protein
MNRHFICTLILVACFICSCRRSQTSTAREEAASNALVDDRTTATVDLEDLALHSNDWPKEIHVTVRIKTVVLRDGKRIGDVELQPGTRLKLEEINGEQLTVSIGSMIHTIDADATDLNQQVIAIRKARSLQQQLAQQTAKISAKPPPQPQSTQKAARYPGFGGDHSESSGLVHVRGYYRKNGTYVQPYDRQLPQ